MELSKCRPRSSPISLPPFERRAKSLPCSVEEVSGYREGSILCGVYAITAQIGYNNLSGELNRVSGPYCIIRIMTLVTFALCNMVQHPVGWKQGPDLIDLRQPLEGLILWDIWLLSSLTED